MLRIVAILALAPFLVSASQPAAESVVKKHAAAVDAKIAAEMPDLIKLYEHLHANPEVSMVEVETAARMADELRKAGYEVTQKVGGTGVVGVMKNGPGPTLLLRADMDGLPVKEQTGLKYASMKTMKDRNGNLVPTMHACGHDIHMTSLVGTARTLAALKDKWSGTLVLIMQPGEEIGAGANAMLADGLFKRFPKPDACLAFHVHAQEPAGKILYTEGTAMANVDSVDVIVKGVGGHGSSPESCVDPIVLAAKIVLDLQTIVSRELKPGEPGVVTVGSIHGGTKHNIIPSEVKLQLTVRSLNDKTRDQILKSIERIVKAAAVGMRAPEPAVKVRLEEFTPATVNDPALTKKTMSLLREYLPEDMVKARPPVMGGEDFGRYGHTGIPICMFFLGTIGEERMANVNSPLPSLHSDGYAPVAEPSITAGVKAMSLAALNLLDAK